MSRAGLVSAVLVLCVAGGAAAIVLADSDGGRGSEPAASATGRWTAQRPSLLARTEVAAARVGRFVYVVGGFERRSGRSTAAVERYDLRRDRWRRVRSMPVALNHPAAAAYRGDVYVLGGYTGRGDLRGEVASLYRYDPARDRWSRLPDAPTRRAALAVGVMGGKLYAAGGANSSDGALRTLEIYDFAAPPVDTRSRHGPRARAPRGRDRRWSVLRARRPRGRARQLQGRRALPARASGAGSGCRTWKSLAAASAPRRSAGASWWSAARSSPGTIREVEAYDPARAALGPAAGPAHATARTRRRRVPRARVRDRGRPRTGLLLLPRHRGACRQVARRSHIAFCSPMVSSLHFFARGCQT